MTEPKLGRKTAQGFADPNAPSVRQHTPAKPAAAVAAPAPAAAPEFAQPAAAAPIGAAPAKGGPPLVEVEVTYERGPIPRAEPIRRTFEIWTQNTVYAIDSKLYCVEVRNPASGTSVADHPFLGCRMVGGQLQGEEMVEMSYPLPRPGSFAVFESRRGKKRKFSRTSRVDRVVLRLRIVTITGGDVTPNWEDLLLEG